MTHYFRLEVTLEKRVEGMTWTNLLKDLTGRERQDHLPLSEGLEDHLSPEELERAKKMLAEMGGASDDVVSDITGEDPVN